MSEVLEPMKARGGDVARGGHGSFSRAPGATTGQRVTEIGCAKQLIDPISARSQGNGRYLYGPELS
jgi:hypothetical protein